MEFLRTKQKKIVTEKGEEVFLRGTAVGGWMNMENFINGFPGTESALKEVMEQRLGKEKTTLFFENMMDNFLNEEDIKFISSTGVNCVRLAVNYRHFEDDENPYVYKEEGFRRLKNVLALCEKYHIYAILDMHAIQGYQNTHWHSDNARGISLFWRDKQYQERYYALMQEMAHRFKDMPALAGYELFNEPSSNCPYGDYPYNMYENYISDYSRYNAVVFKSVEKIREVDSKHIIFIEGDSYGHNFMGLEEPFDDNLVYSSHDYIISGFGPGKYPGFYETLHNDRVEERAYWDYEKQINHICETEGWKFSEKYQVPLWVGEFGSQYCTGEEDNIYRLKSMDDQLRAFKELGIHWTTWTYKDCGVMGWVTLSPDSDYLKHIEPVQKMKGLLGAENFTAWRSSCPGKEVTRDFTEYMMEILGQSSSYTMGTFQKCMGYALLTGFAAGVLQPEYAELFQECNEEEIKEMLKSFRLENCNVNEQLISIIRKNL